MNCETARPLLAALADDELPDDVRREVETHAAQCASCAAALGDYRAIRGATRATATEESVDIWGAVEARIDSEIDSASLTGEIRRMREEMTALRAEIAELRRALTTPAAPRSTSLDLPYVRRTSPSPFQLV